jgi:biotin carboxyl carrier protein
VRTTVRIGGREREVVVERRDQEVTATVDGRAYRLSVLEPQRGVYSFLPLEEGGPSVEAAVHEKDGLFRVRVRGRLFEAALGAGAGPAPRARGSAGGRRVLASVMPGKVVRVLASPGDRVARGQGLVVVEAMKMENELGAPGDGVLKEVLVAPGQRVEAGAALAVIE